MHLTEQKNSTTEGAGALPPSPSYMRKPEVLNDQRPSLECELDRAWQQVRLLEDGWKEAQRWRCMYEALRAIMAASTSERFNEEWFDTRLAEIMADG